MSLALLAATDNTVYIALGTAVVVSILAPTVTSLLNTRAKREEAKLRREEAAYDRKIAREVAEEDRRLASEQRRIDIENLRQDNARAQIEARAAAERLRSETAQQAIALLSVNEKVVAAVEQSAAGVQHNTQELADIKRNGTVAVKLANGALTAQIESQLWALNGKYKSDRDLLKWRREHGDIPTEWEYAILDEDRKRIAVVEHQLRIRHAALESSVAPETDMETGDAEIHVKTASITVEEAKPLEVKRTVPDEGV